jgi:3-oxoacyl-[acyl-carrier protein] reductase
MSEVDGGRAMSRPVALVTGAGRTVGIAATVVTGLAESGWDVAFGHWLPYDEKMPWDADPETATKLAETAATHGARTLAIAADLADPNTPTAMFDTATSQLGPVTALILSHAEGVNSTIMNTTVESFDLHFAVNTRATWLLIREYAGRFNSPPGTGRIISFTSDHTVGNLPYGASKGAMDRIVLAAAREFADLRITANVINPGPVDTGWMTEQQNTEITAATPLARLGTPQDCANLVTFLCSPAGAWINGQLLYSNGGIA